MTTIYFIDASVSNYQSIENELGASATIVVLQPNKNGLEQITNYLAVANATNLDAIHIFSHGSAGELLLGNSTVSTDTLNQHADLLAKIGQSLSSTGDILLYGCDVAQGEVGQNFVNTLANLTGADVAASNDLTGSAALGGDWDLEVKTGVVEARAVVDLGYGAVLVATAPTAANKQLAAYAEDGTYTTTTITSSNFSFADVNGDSFRGVFITANNATSTQGTWEYQIGSASSWTAIIPLTTQGFYIAASSSNSIHFKSATNYNGAVGSLSFVVDSSSDTTTRANGSSYTLYSGSTNYSATSAPYTLSQADITAVNDAPTATNLNAAENFTEDATSVSLTDIVISDVDTDATETATLTLSDKNAGVFSTATGSSFNSGTGVWTATSTLANVNILLANVTFTPAANYDKNFTIATSVTDGTATAITETKTVTVTAVNDAPTVTSLNTAESFTEDATSVSLTDIVISDVDTGATETATLTLSDKNAGVFSTATGSSFNSGTGVWTATGTLANVNTLLANVTFTPAANYDKNFTIATSVTDGTATAITETKTVTVTAVNDAPVLANTIPTIIQVAGAPTPVSNSVIGTLVSSLASSSNVTDVDGTGLGIAITAVDSTQGNWWYTTNNGTNWTLVNPVTTPTTPVVSATNALFLAADANTRLYFDPTSTGTFSITAGATFKAWDQTDSLANGSKHTTFVSGSSGSFIGSVSSNNANAPVSVVNADLLDTVALDDFSSVIRAGTEAAKNYKVRGNTTASNFTDFDDSDTSKPTHHRYDQESGASQSVTKYVDRYAVNTTDANHILKNVDTTTFDHNEYKIGSYGTLYLKDGSSTTAASYVYVPDDAAVNALNAGFYTETFGVKHYTSYSNKAFSGYTKTDTVTFTIVGVNDAPIFTSLTSSVAAGNEDNQISVSFIDLTTQGNESDVDGSVAAFTVKAVSTGTLKMGTSVNSAADFSITNNTIDSTHFAYWTPDANANGTLNAFTVVAKDSNGLESSTAAVQAQIAVAAVNDVPSFTKSSNQTIDEDAGAQTVSGWAASLSKGGGSDETNQTLSFIVTNDNSQLFSVAPSVDNTGKLTYTPAANANGSATVSVQIHDTGGTTIGGVDTSAAQTFAITVTPVNDAPTFTSFSEAVATGNEDTQISVTMGDLSGKGNENDVDGLDTVTAFIVKALTSGTLKIGANSVSATAWNATTNKTIDATHIAYWTPAANANGTLDAFTVVAKDDGGLESSTPVQAQIAVTAVNDLPQFTDSSHITLTDTSASDTFVNQTGQLTATDVDTGSTQTYGATSSSSVSFTSGGKTYDLAVTGGYGVLHVKSTSGDYVYVPDSSVINAISLPSNPVDSFTVSVSDGFDSPVTKPLTVSITGANDTPIILQQFASIDIADTANQLENFSSIVGDVSATDAESSALTYSIETSPVLSASYGVLTIDSSTGKYTFNPDESKINGLLATDAPVQSVYTLKVADTQGGFVTQDLIVNITGANDDPSLTVDATATALTVTDTALPDVFSALTGSLKGSAPDSGVTYSVTGGTTDTSNLDLISKTTDFGTLTVSKSAGTFSFLPNPVKVNSLKADLNGVSDEFVVQTISNSGTHVTKTLTYNFVGANDNPLLTGSLATLAHGTEDTAYNISASDLLTGYTDVDSTPLSVSDLHATNGDITVSGSDFIFTPHPNFNGTVDLTYTVNDNDSGSVNDAAQDFVLNAVNDAPIATDNLFVIDEDNSHTFSSGSAVTNFGYSDIENDAMVGIKIISIPDVSEGVLKLRTATLANGAEIAQADISNLKFVPASNFNGTAKFDFKVADVADNGGYSKDAQTITFTVNAINDAPTAANNTITLDEDSTHIFSIGEFGYSDVENSPISSITIGTLPSAGVLAFDNSTNVIHADDTIDSGSIEHLTFAPALNENGATYADFTFTVNDGTIESSSANTISLAVTPVNDAPTFTTLSSAVKTGNANSAITVNFADLTSKGNEADIDGTVDAFVVKALSSGTLKIGADAASATDFASGNKTIDATHIAYWTPAVDVKGNNLSAFTVVAKDNGGLESSLPAVQAVVNVLAVNTPGVASISGTPTQGQVLTASVIDANGLQGVNPNFQWKSGGASGTNISGATASTYTLRQSDVGKKIAVAVTYTDNDGFAENDTSEIANNVANINDLGRITISGTAAQGQVLTSALVDDDGLVGVTSVYQWKAGGIIISGATASTYTLTQAEVGKAITVQATYTDNGHTAEAPVSAPTSLVTSIEVNGGTTNVNNNTPHTYIATPGNEIITGTSRSDDTVTYVNSTSAVTVSLAITKSQDTGGSGFDTITKIENLTGSTYGDTLTGSEKANVKNVIDGGTGADTMAGGTGDDTYYVDNVGDVVTEVTKQGVDTVISTVDYSLASLPYVENLTLSGTALNATGNSYANKIIGNASDNVIVGGAGNDSLNGGLGNDLLTGGLGSDHFQLTTAIGSTNIDTITDFAKGDKIDLSKSVFTSLSGSRLAASNFSVDNIGVHKYISYNTATGVLSYDADATGSGLPVQIAVIGTTTHPTLSATDFGIIA